MHGISWIASGALRPRSFLTLTTAIALITAATHEAGTAQEAEDAQTGDAISLDAITVDARKIEEPLQQVPFGITVFDAGSIERQGIDEARNFARSTPGFNFVEQGVRAGNLPNIRGVGSVLPVSGDDTSVPVFIDGVPVPVRAQDRRFFDIESIQVLRGPQNTTFGRNAQAGAINISTADPTFEPLFELGGEVGNLSSGRITGLASGPLSDTLAGRIGVQFDTRDGDVPDENLGEDVRDQNIVLANGKLLWLPTDATEATMAVRYSRYEESPVVGGLLDDPEFPRQFVDMPTSYDLETIGAGLTVVHEFDFATLTSVTGLQYYESRIRQDNIDGFVSSALTGTGLPPETFLTPGANFRLIEEDDLQFSQEIRLNGELGDGTRWLAGLSFFRADFRGDFLFNNPAFAVGDFDESVDSTSYAVFGEVTIPITDSLRAIGGVRFTREIRHFESQFTDLVGTAPVSEFNQDDTEAFNLLTGRAALSYDLIPELTVFASVSRGAKAGGFQLLDVEAALGRRSSQYDPAFTWTYEAGMRGTLFDDTVDISLSGFFNDTTDEHIQIFDVLASEFTLENLDVQTYGVEIESTIRPVTGLSLSAGFALLETEITGSDVPEIEPGNEAPFAPALSFNLAAQYEHPIEIFGEEGAAFGRIDYQYVGARTVDPENSLDLDPFDIVSLRAGWDSETVSVYGFVDNLLDETYAETAFVFGRDPAGNVVAAGVPGLPRRFGFGLTLRF